MSNLPLNWQRKVLEEEAKRKKGRWLVRMTNIGQKPLYLLQEEIRLATGELVDRVQQTTNGVMVVCADSRVQRKVLDLNGWTLEGHLVRASRMECSLSGD